MKFHPVQYSELNARQQETYNFNKIAGVLADYGYSSIRLSDDWNGADFIAQHIDGQTFLRVQLKGRLSFDKKYVNKGLWLCFMHGSEVILYPHDPTLEKFAKSGRIVETESWKIKGQYHFPSLGNDVLALIEEYRIRPVLTVG